MKSRRDRITANILVLILIIASLAGMFGIGKALTTYDDNQGIIRNIR